jgi:Protein of unknown function (DUF3592)
MGVTATSSGVTGTLTKNGRLTRGGFLMLAGLASLFLLSAAVRWPAVSADLMTVVRGARTPGTIVAYAEAADPGQSGAYVATVEFVAAGRGPMRVERPLVAWRSTSSVGSASRLRSDRPVTVAYRTEAPERAVLISAQERWAAIWTIPVGLALLGLAWRFRPQG